MHWAATLGVVVPTALALLAIYLERRNRKTDRSDAERDAAEAGQRADRAHATADAATAAAERSAAATERMAQALEAQSAAAARAAPTPQAAWTLEHSVGDSYLLTNVGTATAYDVDVGTGDMVVRVPPGTWPRAELPPDDAVKVLAARTMGTRDDTVTLTWATELGGGDRKTWRRPLPPKPPTSSVQRPRAEGHYPNRRPGVPRPIVDGSAGDTAQVATAQYVLIGLGAVAELAGIVLAVLEVLKRREDVKGYRERPRSVSASRAVSWNAERAPDADRPGDTRTGEQRLEALEADQRARQDVVEAAKQQAAEAAKMHAEAMSTGLQAKADRDVSEVRDLLLRVIKPTWPVWTSLFLLVIGLALQAVASWLGVK